MEKRADYGTGTGRTRLLASAAIPAVAALVALGGVKPLRLFAQVPAPAAAGGTPAFEAASIKPNQSGALRVTMTPQPGGRFVATNAPLRGIIRNAYQLQDYGLVGGPSWLEADRFDIVAKAASDASAAEVRLMLRTLLADRFKLTMHAEKRDLSMYAMVMARRDGKPGPRLHQTEADCAKAASPSLGLDFPGLRDPNSLCGFLGGGAGGAAKFRGVTMDAFARFLAPTVHRPVIDRTGLTGYFNMDLELTAELGPPPPPPGAPDRFDRSSAPSIFTALREELGLELKSTRGPLDVLVIDRVEQPTPD